MVYSLIFYRIVKNRSHCLSNKNKKTLLSSLYAHGSYKTMSPSTLPWPTFD